MNSPSTRSARRSRCSAARGPAPMRTRSWSASEALANCPHSSAWATASQSIDRAAVASPRTRAFQARPRVIPVSWRWTAVGGRPSSSASASVPSSAEPEVGAGQGDAAEAPPPSGVVEAPEEGGYLPEEGFRRRRAPLGQVDEAQDGGEPGLAVDVGLLHRHLVAGLADGLRLGQCPGVEPGQGLGYQVHADGGQLLLVVEVGPHGQGGGGVGHRLPGAPGQGESGAHVQGGLGEGGVLRSLQERLLERHGPCHLPRHQEVVPEEGVELPAARRVGHHRPGLVHQAGRPLGVPEGDEQRRGPPHGQLGQLRVGGGQRRGRPEEIERLLAAPGEVEGVAEQQGGLQRAPPVPGRAGQADGQLVVLRLQRRPGRRQGRLQPAATAAVEPPHRHPQGVAAGRPPRRPRRRRPGPGTASSGGWRGGGRGRPRRRAGG